MAPAARRSNSIHNAAVTDSGLMVVNKNKPWTEEDDRRLIEFRAAGRSALSMAVALRRSASAVKGRLSVLRKRERDVSSVPPEMKPMSTFDPSQPAILHDRFSDKIETWTGENAADYQGNAIENADGSVEWRGLVFDGWGDVLGG
jgi:hypothetical protein